MLHTKNYFFIFLLVFLFSSQIYSTDISSILKKSVGGEKAVERIKSLKSVYLIGKVNLNGVFGAFEYKSKLPDKYYLSLTFPNFSMEQGYDGTIAWQKDISGQKTELTGSERNEVLNLVYMNNFSYLFDESLQNKKYLGKSFISGNVYDQILFFPTKDDTINTYFEVSSGNKTISKSNQDLFEAISYDSLFQTVENIRIPFYSKSVIEQMNYSYYQIVDSVTFDIDFPDSIFLFQTRDDANYRFPNKNKINLKFEFQNNHIFIPVTLSGSKKTYMLLDSGAGTSIINKPIADELNYDTVGTVPAVGVSGSTDSKLIRTDSLQIGELTLYNQIVGSLNLQNIMRNKINKVEFGGILGNDFLSQFPVLIDYQKKEITIFDPRNYQAPSGGNRINFEYYMLIPTIECSVASVKGKFIVDLGNSFGLILHPNFITTNQLSDKIIIDKTSEQLMGGVGGAILGFESVIDSVLIGDEILLNEKVYIPNKSEGIVGSSEIAGNIGNILLKRYKIFFDYRQNKIILYKN